MIVIFSVIPLFFWSLMACLRQEILNASRFFAVVAVDVCSMAFINEYLHEFLKSRVASEIAEGAVLPPVTANIISFLELSFVFVVFYVLLVLTGHVVKLTNKDRLLLSVFASASFPIVLFFYVMMVMTFQESV